MNLSRLSEESEGKMHSGCTAVTAFLRVEDENGSQTFLPSDFELVAPPAPVGEALGGSGSNGSNGSEDSKPKGSTSKLLHAIKSIGGGSSHTPSSPNHTGLQPSTSQKIVVPPLNVRRVLYCANAGDARGVLCRAGKAVRLTYDHKGSDKQEAKRIMDAGGFVMSGRVNGVLAVTRSLGDSSMKEFVVGSPYTTETELSEQDEFLILACDGVRSCCLLSTICADNQSISYGTSSMTKAQWILCAALPTPRSRHKSFSSTRTATTPQTTSLCWSCASGTPQTAFVQIDGCFPEARNSCEGTCSLFFHLEVGN